MCCAKNGTDADCYPACAEGQTRNSETCECECAEGYEECNGECLNCESQGLALDAETCECVDLCAQIACTDPCAPCDSPMTGECKPLCEGNEENPVCCAKNGTDADCYPACAEGQTRNSETCECEDETETVSEDPCDQCEEYEDCVDGKCELINACEIALEDCEQSYVENPDFPYPAYCEVGGFEVIMEEKMCCVTLCSYESEKWACEECFIAAQVSD